MWPTVPAHPACSHDCVGTIHVSVACEGATSAGAILSTRTTPPSTSPIMHPMNSTREDSNSSARKRSALFDIMNTCGDVDVDGACADAVAAIAAIRITHTPKEFLPALTSLTLEEDAKEPLPFPGNANRVPACSAARHAL